MEIKKRIKENDFLLMEVLYDLGGTNYFSGNVDRRGVYIHFTKVTINGYRRTMQPLAEGNFKVFMVPLKRKSQKRMDEVFEILEIHALKLFELWKEGKYRDMAVLVGGYDYQNAEHAA